MKCITKYENCLGFKFKFFSFYFLNIESFKIAKKNFILTNSILWIVTIEFSWISELLDDLTHEKLIQTFNNTFRINDVTLSLQEVRNISNKILSTEEQNYSTICQSYGLVPPAISIVV